MTTLADSSDSKDVIGGSGAGISAGVSAQQREGGSGGVKDPELGAIVDAWPTLPEAIRAGIVAMVRAAGSQRK